jgi:hypothetical protein
MVNTENGASASNVFSMSPSVESNFLSEIVILNLFYAMISMFIVATGSIHIHIFVVINLLPNF